MVLLNRGSSFYEVINIPRKLFPVFEKNKYGFLSILQIKKLQASEVVL